MKMTKTNMIMAGSDLCALLMVGSRERPRLNLLKFLMPPSN